MKALKTLLIGMLAFTATEASAQVFEAQDGTKYEFQKHWFFDLEGGVQYTLGEAKLRRLIRPNVQVAIGRQFACRLTAGRAAAIGILVCSISRATSSPVTILSATPSSMWLPDLT